MQVAIYLLYNSSKLRFAASPLQDNTDHTGIVSEGLQDIQYKFDVLKSQYQALAKVSQTSTNDSGQPASSLPFTREEEEVHFTASQRLKSPSIRHSIRNSVASGGSGTLEWFDAEDDGPQEFIMDLGPEQSEPGSRLLPQEEETGQDSSSIDTDIEEHEKIVSPLPKPEIESPTQTQNRRTQLPCLPPSDEGSLFGILKKNVGKVRPLVFGLFLSLISC